jgi:acyl-CoA synthetase (AMP-forming)/AMP-acid ligase II
MHLTMLLDMIADGMSERTLIGTADSGLTGGDLGACARAGAQIVHASGARTVVYLGGNGPAFPVALFAAATCGVPFLPLNYRLGDDQLTEIMARQDAPLVLTDTPRLAGGRPSLGLGEFLAETRRRPDAEAPDVGELDPEAPAVLLMTSGTTAAPKSAVLRHRHLTSYVLGSVDFMSANEPDATIVSVPPYHIAAVANLLSNIYAGRRIVYLDHFTAAEWLDCVEAQRVTHAMVVPTMLVRIVDELNRTGRRAPSSLRSLSYGGAKISANVLLDALRLFPDTGFVNAYGLTETASSVAVLGPEDHRAAVASHDPEVRARLGSVGRALPAVEIEVHDDHGQPCGPGEVGNIVVRGPQVAGEYRESGTRLAADGWLPTRDRSDDTIIRGGENIAPSEIESVLAAHPAIAESAVAGVPDEEWGQRIVAFVVLRPGAHADAAELAAFVRGRLRSSKTPDEFVVVPVLPTTPTGKILRRSLVDMLSGGSRPESD